MHERTALQPGEHRLVNLLRDFLVVGEDETAARTAQGLVAGGGHDVGMWEGARVHPGGHQARNVGHVHHEVRPHRMGDGAHALEVDDARIRRRTADDEGRMQLIGHTLELVIVNALGLGIQRIRMEVVDKPREVHRRAMGQVPALLKRHAEHGVARLDKGLIRCGIRGGTGMRLDIGILATENLLRALASELLDDVDLLAAAVVALARISFGILIGKDATNCLHHGRRGEILGCDELDAVALARELLPDGVGNGRVGSQDMLKGHGVPFLGPNNRNTSHYWVERSDTGASFGKRTHYLG